MPLSQIIALIEAGLWELGKKAGVLVYRVRIQAALDGMSKQAWTLQHRAGTELLREREILGCVGFTIAFPGQACEMTERTAEFGEDARPDVYCDSTVVPIDGQACRLGLPVANGGSRHAIVERKGARAFVEGFCRIGGSIPCTRYLSTLGLIVYLYVIVVSFPDVRRCRERCQRATLRSIVTRGGETVPGREHVHPGMLTAGGAIAGNLAAARLPASTSSSGASL